MPPPSQYDVFSDDATSVNEGVDEGVGGPGPTDVQVDDEAEAATPTEHQGLIEETFVNDDL